MADNLPISYQQILDLASLGVQRQYIGFNHTSVSSEKFVCVRTNDTVTIYDPTNPSAATNRSIKADHTIMHPTHNILALRAGTQLQVYKLTGADATRFAAHTMSSAVEYWKWISPNTIAVVTSDAVYHWNVEAGAPQRMFARLNDLAGHQIINYQANHDLTWSCLVGIAKQGDRIVGHSQLFSAEKNVSQPIEAHAVAFGKKQVGAATHTVFAFTSRNTAAAGEIWIMEVGVPNASKVKQPVYFPDTTPNDFPLAVAISDKYSVLYMITKEGYFHLMDLESGKRIMLNQISNEPFFAGVPHIGSSGILAINASGKVVVLSVNEQKIIPYITNTLGDVGLAISLSSRGNLPGAEGLFSKQFDQLIASGQYQAAAQVAANSPQGILRTSNTIRILKSVPPTPGQNPLQSYFSLLLDKGALNELESNELVQIGIGSGRKDLLENWVKENKLHPSEQLGDMIRAVDFNLSLVIYEKAKAHHKVVAILAEHGHYDAMVAYSKRESYTPNWMQLLQAVIARNPPAAKNFAKMLLTAEGGALMDVNSAVDAFMARGHIKDVTALLLDILENNRPEDSALQTRLLEINLKHAPNAAEEIFRANLISHYDRAKISQLAEQANLIHRAIENAPNMNEVKRLLSNSQGLSADFLVSFFGSKNAAETLEGLRELLKTNPHANLEAVVAVGVRYTPAPSNEPNPDSLRPEDVVNLFEEHGSYQGTYLYLKQIVPLYKNHTDVVFKYIEAAAKVGAAADVETACRSLEYDPVAVRELLKEIKLTDQLPLVIVCDKHGFVEDLTHYLFRNNMFDFISKYVQNINPSTTPQVVGALLDENCDENRIKELIDAVGHLCPVESLVAEVEKRDRLKLLRPWLEARFAEGNRESATHDALAKILIITNDDRKEQFLEQNQFYDSLKVGEFCENNYPNLALIAYIRGNNFNEVIRVTTKHSMFKNQAKFLVDLQNSELWASVLSPENENRRQLIDQVVQTILPDIQDPVVVSHTVQAFMAADMPEELIGLLDRLVVNNSNPLFSENKSLQDLLLRTAIQASTPEKVMEYVDRLSKYTPTTTAEAAVTKGLFEVAFIVYKKAKLHVEAIGVLVDKIGDLVRAQEYAVAANDAVVFSKLANAQLQKGDVVGAIKNFLSASDPNSYFTVIDAAKEQEKFAELVDYLRMARKIKKEKIETELAYALAKTGNLAGLEEFIGAPNLAKISEVGENCFSQGLYDAAKLCFAQILAYPRLASTLVKIGDYNGAVEAARKANNINTWKEVCGLQIITYGDELDEIVQHYERRMKAGELITLLESALGLERAHRGMFTSLAALYSNYKPEKLMEHINLFHARMHIPKVCNVVKANQQWKELAQLYKYDNENDRALRVMMEHSVDAFDDMQFKEILARVKNHDVYYDAVLFYINEQPEHVNEMLGVIQTKVDHVKVVDRVRKVGQLPLIRKYLEAIQDKNLLQVNVALNELYIEEEDYDSLKTSLDTHDNVDSISLAQSLEKSDLMEFRRVAAHLYKQNKRYKYLVLIFRQAIDLSKKDKLYKDAMETVAASQDRELAAELLEYFVEIQSPHSFSAALFACYDLVAPDMVLELAWRNKWTDFIFPYLIQVMREYTGKVDRLVEKSAAPSGPQSPPPGVPPPGAFPPQGPPPSYGTPGPYGAHPPPGFPPGPGPYGPPPGAFPPPATSPVPQTPPPSNFDPNDFSGF